MNNQFNEFPILLVKHHVKLLIEATFSTISDTSQEGKSKF